MASERNMMGVSGHDSIPNLREHHVGWYDAPNGALLREVGYDSDGSGSGYFRFVMGKPLLLVITSVHHHPHSNPITFGSKAHCSSTAAVLQSQTQPEQSRANNQSDANIVTMAYFLYKEDIAHFAGIGVPYFSFSISRTRIVPFGVAGSPINIQGLEHYNDVINTGF
ncbi:uncharacterized protein BJX67DRAFT_377371 [Aspergillus lucknowensis]|uniref:Uncharacterized protein n=1 Tax=Aspergillus lucknowensis TaxID=176173 RepID=A0ABR4M4U6_9EURO